MVQHFDRTYVGDSILVELTARALATVSVLVCLR